MSSPLPPHVARHFPGEAIDPARAEDRSRLIALLLEEGDRADLAWLAQRVGHDELATWYERHAGRRLSRRSRAFWGAVLERPSPEPPAAAEALWPLA